MNGLSGARRIASPRGQAVGTIGVMPNFIADTTDLLARTPRLLTALLRGLPGDSGLQAFVVLGSYPWTIVLYMLLLGAFVGAVGSGTAATRFLDV